MNPHIFQYYLNEYKLNFNRINFLENYKWQAVKYFQENWDINAVDFSEMLIRSMKKTKNLLNSSQYFPLRMLTIYAEQQPEQVRTIFSELYNEDANLFERIENFKSEINKINEAIFDNRKSYQDHRTVIVYLALRYPEEYFFYKFEMFKQFSENLEITSKPKKGKLTNIELFNSLCKVIRHELSIDQEVMQLHKNRISSDCYLDESLNILTQDFIYAVARYLDKKIDTQSIHPNSQIKQIKYSASDLQLTKEEVNFRGRTINFLKNEKENKRIGDLGEEWVMNYEKQKLKNAHLEHLIAEIIHTSKHEGDGTGYDIQSFDITGNEIFIEVKTTKGKCASTFFITRHELERSKIEKEKYLLYRLFNFNEKEESSDLLIISGDLTTLCELPTLYKINLQGNF